MIPKASSFEPEEIIRWPCPVCGEAHPDHFILNRLGHLLGCSECLCAELPESYYEALYGGH